MSTGGSGGVIYPFFDQQVGEPYQRFFDNAKNGIFPPRFKLQDKSKLYYTSGGTRIFIDTQCNPTPKNIENVCRFLNRCLNLNVEDEITIEPTLVSVKWVDYQIRHDRMLYDFCRQHGLRRSESRIEARRIKMAILLGTISPKAIIIEDCQIVSIKKLRFDASKRQFRLDLNPNNDSFKLAIVTHNQYVAKTIVRKAKKSIRLISDVLDKHQTPYIEIEIEDGEEEVEWDGTRIRRERVERGDREGGDGESDEDEDGESEIGADKDEESDDHADEDGDDDDLIVYF